MKDNKLFLFGGIGLMLIAGIMLVLIWLDVVSFPFDVWVAAFLLAFGGGLFKAAVE